MRSMILAGLVLGACATTAEAQYVRCWGAGKQTSGGSYQFGQSIVPPDLGYVIGVDGGLLHSVAVSEKGIVRCWGAGTTNNPSAANGFTEYGQSMVPTDLGTVVAVAAGYLHTVSLDAGGVVRCWGSNSSGQCTVPGNLGTSSAIAASAFGTMALTSVGTVRTWGNLGSALGGVYGATAIAAGAGHVMALKTNGRVVCDGDNANSQCQVPFDLGTARAIAAGSYHSMALLTDGTVRCWGSNSFGERVIPVDLEPVSAIAGGEYYSVALLADGTVRAWGRDDLGQCMVPPGLGSVSAVSGGIFHVIAIASEPSPPCPADFNGDYFVEGYDLGVLLSEWGPCITGAPSCRADLDGNGIVDGDDLGSFLGAWGRCRD